MPDVMVAAKPLACGIPLGFVAATERAAADHPPRECTAPRSAADRWRAAWRSGVLRHSGHAAARTSAQTGSYFRMRLTELAQALFLY